MVLNNAMEYAREIGALTHNPLKLVKWAKPRTLAAVDPRVVINAEQARRFLAAVEAYSERGKRLKAFFALMYYAGLRRRGQRTASREPDPPARPAGPVGRDAPDTFPATIRKPLDRCRSAG